MGIIKLLTACGVIGILMTGPGCTRTETLTLAHLAVDSDRDIVVRTKDGRTITFARGNYKIIEREYWTIKGKGILVTNEQTGNAKEWEGEIAFQEIQNIEHTETSTAGKVSIVVIASGLVLSGVFVYFLAHGGWH